MGETPTETQRPFCAPRGAVRHVPLEAAVAFGRPPCRSLVGRDRMDLEPAGMVLLFSWWRFAQLWEAIPPRCAWRSRRPSEAGSKHHRRKASRCHCPSVRPSHCPEKIELKAWSSDGPYLFHSAHRDVIYVSQKRVEGLRSFCCSAGLGCRTCAGFLSERRLGTVWLYVVCQTED